MTDITGIAIGLGLYFGLRHAGVTIGLALVSIADAIKYRDPEP